jgi:hypothetical protein
MGAPFLWQGAERPDWQSEEFIEEAIPSEL